MAAPEESACDEAQYSISCEFGEKLLVVCMAALDSECDKHFAGAATTTAIPPNDPRMVHRDVGVGPGSNDHSLGRLLPESEFSSSAVCWVRYGLWDKVTCSW